jgi:oxalate---CoA ligase
MLTIVDMVKSFPSDRPAIGGIGRRALSYGQLAELAARTVREVNEMGVGRSDRIALVLRNGPEMAAAFIALSASASVAPLNPTYLVDEFALYLSDLQVKALIIEAGVSSPATVAAARLGIPIVEIDCDKDQPAGWFQFREVRRICYGATRCGASEPGDEALTLHTSGTTSRPKIVPLSHKNLASSARNVGATLRLRTDDVGLNIMPLFHIHGLVASLLVSMTSGAQVVCAPAFDALQVYRWLQEARPTWYTAVPTMHQTILARAVHNEAVLQTMRLRFIRSSSAALPSQVATNLEQLFKCPVVEAYGMTEATHQIACNPLPPEMRKIGTVGLPAGPQVAVMDERKRIVDQGRTGEIVVRGPSVFGGYDNHPEANANAFTDGWFRTGDQGFIDADGYITITGRLKEIIIRGGEKIAPREIDEALQGHPAVGQAVAFALPHEKLGEEVAAVIVLKEGMTANEHEIKDFVGARIAKFKVPRRIFFRDQIPKTATGKIQRIGLANALGLV